MPSRQDGVAEGAESYIVRLRFFMPGGRLRDGRWYTGAVPFPRRRVDPARTDLISLNLIPILSICDVSPW